MSWLLWRQHRAQLAIAAAALIAFAIPAWITGTHLRNAARTCVDNGCTGLFDGYKSMDVIVQLTVIVPLLIGLFAGATIVARELESGTATLAWTQSLTRRRWVWTKLVTLVLLTVAVSGAVAGLVTWWSHTRNAVHESRFDGLQFDIQGVAPIGFALFASALGLAAGVLWRRTLPAMATTIAGFVAVRLVVELGLRPHYRAPVESITGLGASDRAAGDWSLGTEVMRHGRVILGAVRAPLSCQSSSTRDAMSACMDRLGYRLRWSYQPAGRYWPFQWIEFGIFAALAVVLTVVAVVALRRRDG